MQRTFFPIGQSDGSISWINLAEAAEIHRVSDELCVIRFSGGLEVTIPTKEGADAVVQAIREQIIVIEDLPKAPQSPGQNR